jgi:hypothetical protein
VIERGRRAGKQDRPQDEDQRNPDEDEEIPDEGHFPQHKPREKAADALPALSHRRHDQCGNCRTQGDWNDRQEILRQMAKENDENNHPGEHERDNEIRGQWKPAQQRHRRCYNEPRPPSNARATLCIISGLRWANKANIRVTGPLA